MGLRARVFLFRRARELVKDQDTESLGSLVYKSGRTGLLHNKHPAKISPLKQGLSLPGAVCCDWTAEGLLTAVTQGPRLTEAAF